MTKIYCTYCNAHNFGVHRPTVQTVVDHLRSEHQLPLTISSAEDLKLFRQHLNTAWFERQQRLVQKAGTPDLFKQAKYERVLQEHMAIYDDNTEINEISSISAQQTNTAEDIEAAQTLMDMSNGIRRAPVTAEEIAARYSKEDLEAALELRRAAENQAGGDLRSNDVVGRSKRRFFGLGKVLKRLTNVVRRRG